MNFRNTLCWAQLTISLLNVQSIFAICGGEADLHVGWFSAWQGKSQHIDIEGLIGDDFSVNKHSDQNLLVGAGYYFDLMSTEQARILYGINAFYLAPTEVKGKVTQEDLFTNLSYHYKRSNYPVYLATKALINFCEDNELVIDLGLGINTARTTGFKEKSLDGTTLPDKIFSGKNQPAFSATAGLGWRFNICKKFALEIDYRFFFLGKGKLKRINDQVLNTIRTGNCYGNALFFTITI